MKRIIITLILIILFISLFYPAKGEEEIIENILTVDYNNKLKLEPGEKGTIFLIIKNIGNVSLYIGFDFVFNECPGSPRGKFNPDCFLL